VEIIAGLSAAFTRADAASGYRLEALVDILSGAGGKPAGEKPAKEKPGEKKKK
jgi:hypothetical protein